ncbi:hypothetical protein N7541_000737 [Penicillium brevicompactum]|uniref:Uncharacterized protein n=1 Tax=Penicillium brevicompactum TaxID=5074 RepID=A0A9W9RUX5_PENBR|nr:hypothetical protein N7541_000737 [Penicillium brevicompactum]
MEVVNSGLISQPNTLLDGRLSVADIWIDHSKAKHDPRDQSGTVHVIWEEDNISSIVEQLSPTKLEADWSSPPARA